MRFYISADMEGIAGVAAGDSRGNRQGLILEEPPQDVQVVRSRPRPLGMMQGMEWGSFDGATAENGVPAHAFHGRALPRRG